MKLHIPIFDGHNDTLLRLFASKPNDSFFDSTQGHIDLVRARAGGFAGGFFAVFVPSAPDEQPANDDDFPEQLPFAYALETSLAMTALLFRIEAQSAGQMRVARTIDDIEHGIRTNTLSAILHFEGADAIDPEFHTLEVLTGLVSAPWGSSGVARTHSDGAYRFVSRTIPILVLV